jgi:hypothetical protein
MSIIVASIRGCEVIAVVEDNAERARHRLSTRRSERRSNSFVGDEPGARAAPSLVSRAISRRRARAPVADARG